MSNLKKSWFVSLAFIFFLTFFFVACNQSSEKETREADKQSQEEDDNFGRDGFVPINDGDLSACAGEIFEESDQITGTVKLLNIPCDRIQSEEVALEHLDLSNTHLSQIDTCLRAVDPSGAYPLFIRGSKNFLLYLRGNFSLDLHSLSTAIHELSHIIKGSLYSCGRPSTTKYFFEGQIHQTDLMFEQTANYSIVEETISPDLKSHTRYKSYIEEAKKYSNTFETLLDELVAYTADASFVELYIRSGLSPNYLQGKSDSDITSSMDGMVNFMVFLQYYLKSARLNYPDTYDSIKSGPATIAFIQLVWSRAEELLTNNYNFTKKNNGSGFQVIYTKSYLKAAYSSDLLEELDLLRIEHRPLTEWNTTYLK